METNGDRIERPVRAEVPPRDLQFTHAILLRGSSSQFKLLQFFFFLLNFFKIADCFFQCVEKIGAFPHSYHIDGFPCQTHVSHSI